MRLCPRCHTQHPDAVLVCHSAVCGEVGTPLVLRPHTVTAPMLPAAPPGPAALVTPPRGIVVPEGLLTPPPPRTSGVAPPPAIDPTGSLDISAADQVDPHDLEDEAAELARGSRTETAAMLAPHKRAPRRQVDARAEDAVGRTLGSYRLMEVIGRGGMGRVYRAEHVRLGRQVAIKLLKPEYAVKRDAVARFFQEAKAVNKIRHRNIVDVTDFVELDDGTTFIIMELLEGVSLGKALRTRGPMEPARLLAILVQVCDALEAAHGVGIVHRDLKPDNIFLVHDDVGEVAKLLDFGVAKLLVPEADEGADPDEVVWQTAAGSVVGTPAYMSPEQAGSQDVDGRSDVYALGAIMYELFCGQPLFRGKSFGDFVVKHMNEPPVPPRQTPGGATMSYELEEIILRCLKKRPGERFQSAGELRDALFGVLAAMDTGLVDLRRASLGLRGSSGRRMVEGAPPPMGSGGGQGGSGVRARGPSTPPPHASTPQPHASTPQPRTPPPAVPPLGLPLPAPQASLPGVVVAPAAPVGEAPDPAEVPSSNGLDTRMVLGDLRGEAPQAAAPVARRTWPYWTAGGVMLAAAAFLLATGIGRDPVPRPRPGVAPRVEPVALPPAPPPAPQTLAFAVRTDPVGAEVFELGSDQPRCSTPCEVVVDPSDGGSTVKRLFVIKKAGYLDHQIEVRLDGSPPPAELVLLMPVAGERRPTPERPERVERDRPERGGRGKKPDKVAEPPPKVDPPAPEPPPERKPPDKKPDKIDRTDTLDPFAKP